MTYSQKSAWIETALDTMVSAGVLNRSKVKPNEYYISNLDVITAVGITLAIWLLGL